MIGRLVFLLILIGVNAFFAASEIALISLNDNKIKLMAEEGNKKAGQLVKLLGEPSRFLATIQIGITLAGFLASAFAAESFANPIVQMLQGFGIQAPESILRVTTVIVITVVLAYFTLVLGELVPKRVAMKKSEGIAFFVVGPLMILSKVTSPFVKFLTISTNFFVRLFGVDPHSVDDDVTEEEIRLLVDVGEEKGAIAQQEKVMINNVFEFNNKTAEDIMTHRIEIVGIPVDIDLDNLVDLVEREKYSRIPVYEGSLDNIVGVLYAKDLITLIKQEERENFSLDKFIRKPFFTPMQKKINQLFFELQGAKNHLAVVLDEYGGTAGIVTVEDLVEEIVGNIFDEYDEEEDLEFKKINEHTYEISGMISLYELETHLGIELPVEEHETLNGFFINLYGNIPPKGVISEVRFQNLRILAVEVTDKRIEKVMIYVEDEHENEPAVLT